jgi:hypothetical protein
MVFHSNESIWCGNVVESLIFTDGVEPAAGTQPDTHPAHVHINILDGGDIGRIGRR